MFNNLRFLIPIIVFFLLHHNIVGQRLIFRSGFESGSTVVNQTSSGADIIGKDETLSSKSDWQGDLESHPNIGKFGIQYQDYNTNQQYKRRAEIVKNPTGTGGNVLKFWMIGDNVTYDRGRIQANIYGAQEGIKELYQRVKLFLPSSSFDPIIEHPDEVTFLTITEIWNNRNWNPDFGTPGSYPYRMNVNIVKQQGVGKPLRLKATGEQQSRACCWGEGNDKKWEVISNGILPLDTWLDIELYIKEGDANSGKFRMAITPSGQAKQLFFDITGYTHHPDDPNPDGIKFFNPLKLYTKDFITIDKVVSRGDSLKIYWDDFRLFKNQKIAEEDKSSLHHKTITLQSSTDHFVSSENGLHPMTATRTKVDAWERFVIQDKNNDGIIALKANNGKFVRITNGATLISDSSNIDAKENFTWTDLGNGKVALKGNNGSYISSENGFQPMTCNRTTIDKWEAFTYTFINEKNATTINAPDLIIYPNPATSMLSIHNPNSVFNTIQIIDLQSKVVMEFELSGRGQTINLENLSKGVYLVKSFGSGKTQIETLIKN